MPLLFLEASHPSEGTHQPLDIATSSTTLKQRLVLGINENLYRKLPSKTSKETSVENELVLPPPGLLRLDFRGLSGLATFLRGYRLLCCRSLLALCCGLGLDGFFLLFVPSENAGDLFHRGFFGVDVPLEFTNGRRRLFR